MSPSEVAVALQKLTNGRGLYRPDLINALRGELSPLRRCWSVHLIDGDVDSAQRSVASNLGFLINQLKPRPAKQRGLTPEQRKRQYQHAIRIFFNLPFPNTAEFRDYISLRGMTLTERRNWLSEKSRGTLRLSVSAGQDDLNFAIAQIEEMILANGYRPLTEISEIANEASFYAEIGSDAESSGLDDDKREAAPAKQRLLTPPQMIYIGLTAFVVVFASGIVYGQLHKGRAPSTPASLPASNTAIAAANPANLSVSVNTITDAQSGHSVVFPSPTAVAAQRYTAQTSVSTDSNSFMEQELRAGAYALGGLNLNVNLDSTNQAELTVYNIEPVNIRRASTVTGSLMAWGAQGGGNTRQMYFDLDNLDPTAKTYDNTAHAVGGPFFDSQRIGVSASQPQTLEMYLVANQGSYLFDIKVDYELDKKQYSTTLDFNGKPFAVTADLCKPGTSGSTSGATNAYQLIRYVSEDPSSLGKIFTLDPKTPCTGL